MSASNHTPNYNLPQYVSTDKPSWLGDVNSFLLAIDTALKSLLDSKANMSTEQNKTLISSNWVGDIAPFTYTLLVDGVTGLSNQDLIPTTTITLDQLNALQKANMVDGGQALGSITLKAFGAKPSIDIPLRVILRGDK